MASASMIALTEYALKQFVTVYDDVKAEKGFDGPSGDKLFTWMMGEITHNRSFKDEAVEPPRKVSDEAVQEQEPELKSPAQEPSAPVQEPVQQPAQEPAQGPAAPVPGITKIDGRLLKKVLLPEETKTNKKGEPVKTRKAMDLPYLPHCVDYSKCCQALSLNGGLYSPCMTRPLKGSQYCKACESSNFKYGKLTDREACVFGEYKDPSGRAEVSWGTWAKRRNLTSDKVNDLIEEALGAEVAKNISIPESYYVLTKRKAKTSPSVSSDEVSSVEGSETGEKKKRGRPAKKASAETGEKKKRGRPVKKAVQQKPEDATATAPVVAPLVEEPQPKEPQPEEPQPEEPEQEEDEMSLGSLDDEASLGGLDEEEPESKEQAQPQTEAPPTKKCNTEMLEKNPENGMQMIKVDDVVYSFDEDNNVYHQDENGEFKEVGVWNPETQEVEFEEY